MAFGIAKGFGFEKMLERQLVEKLPGNEEITSKIIEFSHALLENTRGGLLAGMGVVLLLWAVLKVLGNIEESFNEIWGVREHRSMGRKISDYLSIMFVSPVLVIVSSSVTVTIATNIRTITEKVSLLGVISPLIFFALKVLPYLFAWVLLTFVYIVMPNTKVRFSSAAFAGIIAGTIYGVVQWFYINFQIGAAKYNAIYGSFAALPLFLIWLQVSWLVILLGAEISFAHQNVDTYEFEPESLQTSTSLKRLLSLGVAHIVIDDFAKGKKPPTASQISARLEMPIRLTRLIIHELVSSGIFSSIRTEDDKESAYQPARDIGLLTVQTILRALDKQGNENVMFLRTDEMEKISDILKEFERTLSSSPVNCLVKDI
jgi:membrane protein